MGPRRTFIAPLGVVVVVLWAAVGSMPPGNLASASPALLVVDDDGMASAADCDASTATFSTISAAEGAAMSGDTIKVCPGFYAEKVFIDVNNLTLLGAQAGVDARTRATLPADESIIDHPCGPVQIASDNVVLDGFTVQGSSLSDPCFIAGIWTNPGFFGTNGGHHILNNIVQNNIFGIYLNNTCALAAQVVHNLIQNNNNPGPASGNGVYSDLGLCNAAIDANKFTGHTNSSILVFGGSSLSVTNNELGGGFPERIVFCCVSNSTVNHNVSVGSTSSATVRLFGGNSNVAVDSNTLRNGMRGIRVDDPFAIGVNSGISAHLNCIQGNSIAGLQVDSGGHSGTLNAENDWWGSSSGPTNPNNPGGTGDAVIDPGAVVDFVPWLTVSPPLPGCPPPPSPTHVKGTGGGQVPGSMANFGFNAQVRDGSSSGHFEFNEKGGPAHHCRVTAVTFASTTTMEFDVSCNTGNGHVRAEDNQKQGSGAGADKLFFTQATTKGGTLVRGQITIQP